MAVAIASCLKLGAAFFRKKSLIQSLVFILLPLIIIFILKKLNYVRILQRKISRENTGRSCC